MDRACHPHAGLKAKFPGGLTPAHVRRDFRHICRKAAHPAGAPKPSRLRPLGDREAAGTPPQPDATTYTHQDKSVATAQCALPTTHVAARPVTGSRAAGRDG
ncbi:hypothetical protein GCM10010234_67170 [Streptomyces hawaiiensis]